MDFKEFREEEQREIDKQIICGDCSNIITMFFTSKYKTSSISP
jgi:hypothetical protein